MKTVEKIDQVFAALAFLVDPMPCDRFLQEGWGRDFLHARRKDPGYFSSLISVRELDGILGHSMTREHLLLIHPKHGRYHHPNEETKSLSEVFAYFSQGYGLQVLQGHLCSRPLGELTNQLACEFGFKTQSEIRIYPSDWISRQVQLLETETILLQPVGEMDLRIRLPGKASQSLKLKQGDSLYLPKGTQLERDKVLTGMAIAVVVQVFALTYRDLLHQAIEFIAEKEVDFRRGLPLGLPFSGSSGHEIATGIRDKLLPKLTSLDWEKAQRRLSFRVKKGLTPLPDGHFTRLRHTDGIDEHTTVMRRPGMVGSTQFFEGKLVFQFPGHQLLCPEKMFLAADFILGKKVFRVKDIPGWYTDKEKVIWVKHLVRKGFLSMA